MIFQHRAIFLIKKQSNKYYFWTKIRNSGIGQHRLVRKEILIKKWEPREIGQHWQARKKSQNILAINWAYTCVHTPFDANCLIPGKLSYNSLFFTKLRCYKFWFLLAYFSHFYIFSIIDKFARDRLCSSVVQSFLVLCRSLVRRSLVCVAHWYGIAGYEYWVQKFAVFGTHKIYIAAKYLYYRIFHQ